MTLVYGKDFQGKLVPLFVGADGSLQIDPSSIILSGEPFTISPAGYLYVAPMTIVGENYDAIYSTLTNTSLAAGASNQLDTAVPSNQAYRLKNIAALYTGTIAGVKLRFGVLRGSTFYQAQNVETVVSAQTYGFAVDIPMITGDQAGIRVIGATLNDDLTAFFLYERIK